MRSADGIVRVTARETRIATVVQVAPAPTGADPGRGGIAVEASLCHTIQPILLTLATVNILVGPAAPLALQAIHPALPSQSR